MTNEEIAKIARPADLRIARALNAIGDVHCQICGRPIRAKTGVIAHHGYTRPQYGSGWQTASCYGARALPYEVSTDRLPGAIAECGAWKARIEQRLADLEGTPTIANPRHAAWLKAKLQGRTRRTDGTEYTEPAPTLEYPGDPQPDEPRDTRIARFDYTQTLEAYRRDACHEHASAAAELSRLEMRLTTWGAVSIERQRSIAAAKRALP